jgi:hypothetical protein
MAKREIGPRGKNARVDVLVPSVQDEALNSIHRFRAKSGNIKSAPERMDICQTTAQILSALHALLSALEWKQLRIKGNEEIESDKKKQLWGF